ncbi:hypothetical protein CEXT_561871 [Caerostris extrusa]|uniref:Uncharacterized protein n=1 Tax=Caerostris extrusa TaxID=172846 RepID=A0AAV4NIB7_CAEEX|nr:hypothetical protein CEXT_561871 [Caerostris extrusa]
MPQVPSISDSLPFIDLPISRITFLTKKQNRSEIVPFLAQLTQHFSIKERTKKKLLTETKRSPEDAAITSLKHGIHILTRYHSPVIQLRRNARDQRDTRALEQQKKGALQQQQKSRNYHAISRINLTADQKI